MAEARVLEVDPPYERECRHLEALGGAREFEHFYTANGEYAAQSPWFGDGILRNPLVRNESVHRNMDDIRNLVRRARHALGVCGIVVGRMREGDSAEKAVGLAFTKAQDRLNAGLRNLRPALQRVHDSTYQGAEDKQRAMRDVIQML